MSVKVCSKCKVPKDLNCFNLCRSRKDGKQPYCKECRKPMAAARYKRKLGATNKKSINAKYCPRCKDTKSSEHFNLSTWSTDGRQSYCRTCNKRKSEYKVVRNKYHRDRLKNDLQFKLTMNLRSRVSNALKRGKAGSAVKDLGCTIAYLRKHLEDRFLPGMSWKNWGNGKLKWNIDHIIPLCKFNLSDRQHFILACSYMNLQPLWFEDNLAKSGNYYIGEFSWPTSTLFRN